MSSFYSRPPSPDEIYHYGIMGMHWGIRRFQPYPNGYTGKGKVIGEAAKASKQQSGQEGGGNAFDVSKEEYAAIKAKRMASGSNAVQASRKMLSPEEVKDVSEQRAKKAEAEKERQEAEKQRVLREGSAAEVLRYKGKLTNQELQSAMSRINLETQLRTSAQKDIQKGFDRIDKTMKTLETMNKWTETGIKTWNSIANIYNASNQERVYNSSSKKWEWQTKKGKKVLNTIKTGN